VVKLIKNTFYTQYVDYLSQAHTRIKGEYDKRINRKTKIYILYEAKVQLQHIA